MREEAVRVADTAAVAGIPGVDVPGAAILAADILLVDALAVGMLEAIGQADER
jgi:hypothetical protein